MVDFLPCLHKEGTGGYIGKRKRRRKKERADRNKEKNVDEIKKEQIDRKRKNADECKLQND
jgi:hypothetical protein